jgi:hypothetical protein
MHIYIYTYIPLCCGVDILSFVYSLIHVCMYLCMQVCKYLCMYVCMYMYVSMYVCMYVCLLRLFDSLSFVYLLIQNNSDALGTGVRTYPDRSFHSLYIDTYNMFMYIYTYMCVCVYVYIYVCIYANIPPVTHLTGNGNP